MAGGSASAERRQALAMGRQASPHHLTSPIARPPTLCGGPYGHISIPRPSFTRGSLRDECEALLRRRLRWGQIRLHLEQRRRLHRVLARERPIVSCDQQNADGDGGGKEANR